MAGPNKNAIRFHRAIFAKEKLGFQSDDHNKKGGKGAGRKAERKKCSGYMNRNVLQCLPTINLMQYLKHGFRIEPDSCPVGKVVAWRKFILIRPALQVEWLKSDP